MHLDDEQVQRWLHDELADATSVRQHVERCMDCRRRVDMAQREEARLHLLLRHLDRDIPRTDAERVRGRVIERGKARPRFRMVSYRAAGLLLATGIAGVAWAAPQSPLPAVVARIFGWTGATSVGRTPVTIPFTLPRPEPDLSGMAIIPRGAVIIRFTASQVRGDARVSLTDRPDLVIRAPAGSASFTSVDDGIEIANEGSVATFEIEVPRSAPRVEIRVAGRRVFLKAGVRVTTASPETTGEYHVVSLAAAPVRR